MYAPDLILKRFWVCKNGEILNTFETLEEAQEYASTMGEGLKLIHITEIEFETTRI